MILYTRKIRRIAVFYVEVRLATKGESSRASKISVYVSDLIRNVLKCFIEEVESLLFDAGKLVFGLFCRLPIMLCKS